MILIQGFYAFLLLFQCVSLENVKCTINGEGEGRYNENEKGLFDKLHDLLNINNIFTIKGIHKSKNETYYYKIGICDAVNDAKFGKAGAVQFTDSKGSNFSLGSIDKTQIMGGDSWVLLTYLGGTSYSNSCNKTARTTKIMIICDREQEDPQMTFVNEETNKLGVGCHYLFELKTSKVCPVPKSQGLSSGSIFSIIFFTCFGLYMFIGVMYRRFIIGAKDIEQIPNFEFWKRMVFLQKDGCEFMCRCCCAKKRKHKYSYQGINDEDDEEADPDDPLLNM